MTIYSISNKKPILNNKKITKKVNQTEEFQLFDEIKQPATSQKTSGIVLDINPFLIFNEIEDEEKEQLKQTGGRMLNCLNDIRLGLLNGEFSEAHLQNLNSALNGINYKFQTIEIIELIEEIKTRAAVELAKLEQNLQPL